MEFSIEKIKGVVNAGLQAPSGDNAQPWQFNWDGERLSLHLDSKRTGAQLDVQNMAALMALGAAIANMRIASQQAGLIMHPTLFPDGKLGSRIADFTFTQTAPFDHPLYPAIFERCTNRKRYRSTPLSQDVINQLQFALDGYGGVSAHLVVNESDRHDLAYCLGQFDNLFYEDRSTHDDILYRWLRWSKAQVDRTKDGLPVASLELSVVIRLALKLGEFWPIAQILKLFGAHRIAAARAESLYRSSAAFGLLSVDTTAPEQLLRAGEAVQMFWLVATKLGVSVHPVTGSLYVLFKSLQNIERISAPKKRLLEKIKEKFLRIFPEIGRRAPVILFRLGYSGAPQFRSLRRPVEDVLTIQVGETSKRYPMPLRPVIQSDRDPSFFRS